MRIRPWTTACTTWLATLQTQEQQGNDCSTARHRREDEPSAEPWTALRRIDKLFDCDAWGEQDLRAKWPCPDPLRLAPKRFASDTRLPCDSMEEGPISRRVGALDGCTLPGAETCLISRSGCATMTSDDSGPRASSFATWCTFALAANRTRPPTWRQPSLS